MWNQLSQKGKRFSKSWSIIFQLKALRLKMYHFHTKLPYQEPMLRQIAWWVQNGPIKKNGVLPVTTLFLWHFFFCLKISYDELILCTSNTNAYICTFCKCESFIWQCFLPVSICTSNTNAYICTFCKCESFIWQCFLPVSILKVKSPGLFKKKAAFSWFLKIQLTHPRNILVNIKGCVQASSPGMRCIFVISIYVRHKKHI